MGAGCRIGYVPQKLDLERDVPITGPGLSTGALQRRHEARTLMSRRSLGSRRRIRGGQRNTRSGRFQADSSSGCLSRSPSSAIRTVLLLDEPTAGVDEPGQKRLNELVHRLQEEQGLTVSSSRTS